MTKVLVVCSGGTLLSPFWLSQHADISFNDLCRIALDPKNETEMLAFRFKPEVLEVENINTYIPPAGTIALVEDENGGMAFWKIRRPAGS